MFYLRDQNGNQLNWFDDFTNAITGTNTQFMKSDIEEDEKEYKVTMDVPGVQKDNLTISYNNETLVVSYKKDENKEEKKKNFINGLLTIVVSKKVKEIENKNIITIE